MAEEKSRTYSAPALDKGFDILELLAETKRPMSLAQISVELKRSKSELFRMLAVLEERGYLFREDGSDFFQISNKLFDLGMSVPPVGTLVEAAFPLMHELSEQISQSCHLAVASGHRMVVVARVESPANIGLSVRVGHHMKLYESGSGQILLAWMRESKRELAYKEFEGDEGFNRELLEKSLLKIKKNNSIRVKSTVVAGVEDLCCPIFMGDHDHIIGALAVPYLKSDQKNVLSSVEILEQMKVVSDRLSEISTGYGGF